MNPEQVCAGVWRSGSRYVNWYVVDAGPEGLTLVDTGLPGYRGQLDKVLSHLRRRRSDVKAVVLTHGHVDHVGAAAAAAATGATVYLHPADEALAADPRRNRTERSLLPYLAWPATTAFVIHCVRQGALRPPAPPRIRPLSDGVWEQIPGRPGVMHTPGHTDGSVTVEFPNHDVVFVGDLLCTVDPLSGRAGRPQLQTRGSNRNSGQALASLAKLEGVHAGVVLPGHGGPWRDGVEAAISSVREIGCR